MLGPLKTWLHNGPRQVLRMSRNSNLAMRTQPRSVIVVRRLNSSTRNFNTSGQSESLSNVNGNVVGKSTSRTLLLLASIASGIAGYAIATKSASSLATHPPNDAQEPQYGTPADFKKAIEELRLVFPKDSVSTDPDTLYVHGFSNYDYHAGANNRV
jgi:hypothetical protein